MTDALNPDQHAVLDFWLGDGLLHGWPSENLSKRWFSGSKALDCEIDQRFGALVEQACGGRLTDWEGAALPRLALVIVLDQFTRNVFRGTARAFQGDVRAQRLAQEGLDSGLDGRLPWVGRVFFLMPLMHAEKLELQRLCVREFEALVAEAPPLQRQKIEGNLRFAKSHLMVVERFARFPHRNEALGRASTAEEIEFLKHSPRFGQ